MKKLLGHLTKEKPDRVDSFKAGGQAFFKWVNANVDDITFYTPKNYDSENHIMVSIYEGEDAAPTFFYIMDGLKFIKL